MALTDRAGELPMVFGVRLPNQDSKLIGPLAWGQQRNSSPYVSGIYRFLPNFILSSNDRDAVFRRTHEDYLPW